MTDNVQLDDERDLSGYAKQRLKFKEELEAKDVEIANLRAQLTANKKDFFKSTLTMQGYKGEFDEFADKYAENLGIDEMVALYKGAFGWPQTPAQAEAPKQSEAQVWEQPTPTIWPKSIIGTNPIWQDQPKDFESMTAEEMKARWMAHPELFS